MTKVPVAPSLYHWRTQNGAEIDAVLDFNGRLFPIEFKAASRLSKHDTRGIQSFRNTYRNAEIGVLIYGGEVPYQISPDAVAIPWKAV
jgi:uncharacterized protein